MRISPKDDGGLLGAAKVAWDAANGVPLRAAIYAQGPGHAGARARAATHISYGPIPASRFDVTPPAGAKVTQISAPDHSPASGHASPT